MPRLLGTVASTPDQESRVIMDNISKAGIGGIFTFPFSLRSTCDVVDFGGENDTFRYRFHKPFVVNNNQPRIYPDVSVEKWPNFQWSSKVPEAETRKPPATIDVYDDGGNKNKLTEYDGLRIDVFGEIDKGICSMKCVIS